MLKKFVVIPTLLALMGIVAVLPACPTTAEGEGEGE